MCAWAVTGERPSPTRWAGIAIIILGGTALSWGAFGHGLSTWPGDLMFVGASACWALYTVLARRWAVSPLDVTVNVAVLAAALYLPVYAVALPKHIAAVPILHEPLTASLAVSMVLVSAGVLVGNAGPRAPRPALGQPLCAPASTT